MAATKTDYSDLVAAIAKANHHPDPKAYAKLVADYMAGKKPPVDAVTAAHEEPTDV